MKQSQTAVKAARPKQTAIVVCPGRASYQRADLGYLQRFHAHQSELLHALDEYRLQHHLKTISALDQAERFQRPLHNSGENGAALIYACSYADFLAIQQDELDIVAVLGNSMGWYTALAVAGALSPVAGLSLVTTMGRLMDQQGTGQQLIYSWVDDKWHYQPEVRAKVMETMDDIMQAHEDAELSISIELGGYLILAGNELGIRLLAQQLEPQPGGYPQVIAGHAAFHTPLMQTISTIACQRLQDLPLNPPATPLIDGRGHQWLPWTTRADELMQYTLQTQVTTPYDFSCSLEVAIKEYAPDRIILLGPGNTLGGPSAQVLIQQQWYGWQNKQQFAQHQAQQLNLVSMGLAEQRTTVVDIQPHAIDHL
ncbi:ACP S-malonyltransferase [Zooshikella harenae]|uniref:[acyl-carrier-protein] S-malonyltransferase n=1 Tax=Zooshikella harenae TaxID=2827238 RepID=A0ABS5ZDL8_9GAMM|nr:ACP S-malonyltransferase [Zooshikella harenae]MBU2711042.1 ACP S-malonyltransferase [Zooshikella harenae]